MQIIIIIVVIMQNKNVLVSLSKAKHLFSKSILKQAKGEWTVSHLENCFKTFLMIASNQWDQMAF